MDVKDILGLLKNTLQLPQEKKLRPPKEPQRKPDAISHELYMLTRGSGAGGGKKAAAVETMEDCSLEELYKGSKRKMKISRVVSDDFGCVLSGGGSVPDPKVHVEAWVNMVNEFQKGVMATRLGIPMQVMDTTSIMPLLPSQRGAWCHQGS